MTGNQLFQFAILSVPLFAIGLSVLTAVFALFKNHGNESAIALIVVALFFAWGLYPIYTLPEDTDFGPGIIDVAFYMLFVTIAGFGGLLIFLTTIQFGAPNFVKHVARAAMLFCLMPLIFIALQFFDQS